MPSASAATLDAMADLYFIQEGEDGPIKIGVTDNLKLRMRDLQAGNPRQLRVLAIWPGASSLEEIAHAAFANARLVGEWFEPAPAILATIAEGSKILGAAKRLIRAPRVVGEVPAPPPPSNHLDGLGQLLIDATESARAV